MLWQLFLGDAGNDGRSTDTGSGGCIVDDRIWTERIGRGLNILGDDVGKNVQSELTGLTDVDAGKFGKVVGQREVWVLDLCSHFRRGGKVGFTICWT